MSTDLQWLLIRKYNSFLVKKVPEGPIFSKEPGNLLNLHSHKYSGLANSKTIDIQNSESGLQITTRKSKASPHAVRPARTTATVRNRSGGRRSLGVVASVAKRGYRPDLRAAALGRSSALLAAQKEKKASPPKKVRGKKATAFFG
ncbi:ribosomal L28e/Mak16 [Suillus subalutaceus]|uniref:ribosomal L28e/Mak16 n=1 Tax=Suillus subalutaceus TaxID=48586 RepID=UPI001B8827D1|nr:ribosomal L28e/Mak16 [Suillus subalutaceus]KAG1842242.1 ribosomal L28e/Mak16 [Suillus subalutaceus]